MPAQRHILIATLGGQPQIVTFTLDILLRTYPIEQVIVVHPQAVTERLQYSLACLQSEFSNDRYRPTGQVIRFRSRILTNHGEPISDITNDQDADGTLDTLNTLIGELKQQGYCIHLSVTGGRRMIGLLAISVASFKLGRHDHVWHLYTPDRIAENALAEKCMHVEPDAGTHLIEGSFPHLGNYLNSNGDTFREMRDRSDRQLERQERQHCRDVVENATKAQTRILHFFAQGLSPQRVADKAVLSLATVNSHKTQLLALCCDAWSLEPNSIDYHFLNQHFSDYFNNLDS